MRKQILIVILVVLFCSALFLGISYLMLNSQPQPTENIVSRVPYTESAESPKGLLFNFADGGSVFLNFDQSACDTAVILLPHDSAASDLLDYGYTVFRTIKTDYTMLEYFIDRIGGIEIDNMRYTGVQITEQLYRTTDKVLRRNVVSAIFKRLADYGLSSENLVFIIENSNTDLSYPDGYSLLSSMESLAKNIRFVN